MIGRLKPGVSLAGAQADIDSITARLEKQYPESIHRAGATVYSLVADMVAHDTPIWVTMGFVGFVLLIACANIANLMLARASGRHKEIALRAALGASRWRIVRQLLTESLIVALIGGAVGVLVVSGASTRCVVMRIPPMRRGLRPVGINSESTSLYCFSPLAFR